MKITLTAPKPRNPLAVPARFRHAGRHQPAGHSQRQQDRCALCRELASFRRTPP